MTQPANQTASAPPFSEPKDSPVTQSAAAGFFWSAVQSWGSRLTQFLVFMILARMLTPTDLGLAASSAVVLLLASQIAEFGFGDAIVQSREIEAHDINGPFFFSIGLACLLTAVIYLASGAIEHVLGVPRIGAVLAVSSGVAPLTTLSLFQEAINRRAFHFRKLALRSFYAQLGGGVIAIISAALGLGVWSLVVQAYSAAIISNVWMWRSAIWTPSFSVRAKEFLTLTRFGSAVVLSRMLDFVTTRALDFIILTFYGVAALGLYTAGARIYLMLLQLLQQVVNDVALAFLSRMNHDRTRMGETYLMTSLASSYFAAPVFFLCAAVTPEITVILFGNRWIGSAELAQPLLFLGAIQSVQFVNGSYLASVGRPHYIFLLNILKAILTLSILILTRNQGIERSIIYFCVAQLLPSPLNFFLVAKELNLKFRVILFRIGPILFIGALTAFTLIMCRGFVASYIPSPLLRAIAVGVVFAIAYLSLSYGFLRKQTKEAWAFTVGHVMKSRRVRASVV